jgi:hypothetical protein
MQHKNCLILHPNAAVVYRIDSTSIELKQKQFQTMLGLVGSKGIEKSSIDLQFSQRRAKVDHIQLVQINDNLDSIHVGGCRQFGKILSKQYLGENMVVTLKKENAEVSYVGVKECHSPIPLYAIKVSGTVSNNHNHILNLVADTHLRYVLSTIETQVLYRLFLPHDLQEKAVLEQTLYIQNDSLADHDAFLCYNSAIYPLSGNIAPDYNTRSAVARSGAPAVAEEVLRPQTISLGQHIITGETMIPCAEIELDNVGIHFRLYVPTLTPLHSQPAKPAVKIPLSAGQLVDGDLKIFDAKGYYLTAGKLVVGSKNATANLNPVHYGVRVSTESDLKMKKQSVDLIVLRVKMTIKAYNAATFDVELYLQFDTRLQTSGLLFNRTSTKKQKIKLRPGLNEHKLTLTFEAQKAPEQ